MFCDYVLLSRVSLLGKRILNVRCSEPVNEVSWVNLVNKCHALDINEAAIEVGRELASEPLPSYVYSKLKFIVGDATELDLEEEYCDVLAFFSTTDYIAGEENRMKAISEMRQVLERAGYPVATVHNKWDFYYSYHSNKLQKNGKAIFGYEYQFSPLELRQMPTLNGIKIIDCAPTVFNPRSYFDHLLTKLKSHKAEIYFSTRFGFLAKKLVGVITLIKPDESANT